MNNRSVERVSGELDLGLLSQVSGCYRVASALALWLTMSTSTSFFIPGTLEAEQASTLIWKKEKINRRVSEGQSQASTITLQHASPVDLDAKMAGDSVLDGDVYTAGRPRRICTRSTSTQVEVKPVSHRDATTTLFLRTTPSELSIFPPRKQAG